MYDPLNRLYMYVLQFSRDVNNQNVLMNIYLLQIKLSLMSVYLFICPYRCLIMHSFVNDSSGILLDSKAKVGKTHSYS